MLHEYDLRCWLTDVLDKHVKEDYKKVGKVYREKIGSYIYVDEKSLETKPDGLLHLLVRYPGISVGELTIDPKEKMIVELRIPSPTTVVDRGPYNYTIIGEKRNLEGQDASEIINLIGEKIKKEVGN